MTELMIWYEWLRAAHIVSFVSWMAGLLYLPRLFVYHASVEPFSEASEVFKVMERKLLRIIMYPALISTWAFGALLLLANPALLFETWMQVKLGAVVLLTVMHYMLAHWRKKFEQDANVRSPKFFRFVNEIPTILMIVIVLMAVIEPF